MGTEAIDSTSAGIAQADEVLEEMIKSTHELDEILQRLCAADKGTEHCPFLSDKSVKTPNDENPESVDEFEDCIDDPITDTQATQAQQYLETVRNVFRARGGGTIEIAASIVDTSKLLASSDSAKDDVVVRFASCTRATLFIFPTLTPSTSDFESSSIRVSSPPEYNVSYSYFLSRLRQQLVACDHIIPVERADEAAQLAFLLLEEQQRRLLGAISNRFPYQRDSVYWVQNSRICEVIVRETEQDNHWGMLLELSLTSDLQARIDKLMGDSSRSNSVDSSDPELLSCTHCRVFLPKTQYLVSSGKYAGFQASISMELSLHVSEKEKVNTDEPSNHVREKSEDQKPASASGNPWSPTELPERISVSIWGYHDENPVLDTQSSTQRVKRANSFRNVVIETPFPRNRIVQAACSRFHTLFLNDMGLVFVYGHPLDGALGLGDELSGYVAKPTLVDFFLDNLIVVRDVSCGGDQLVGAHSAAVSQTGELFTWGVGVALGRGTLRSASLPQQVDLPPIEDGTAITTTRAREVSCGSGFCVVVTCNGSAYSWGKWSDGRLGLGRIPIIARTSRRHGGGAVRKQLQSFQLTPRELHTAHGAHRESLWLKVACGDAHCVGLTQSGELVTWGRGNSGQQGRGDASDALVPTAVFKDNEDHRWRDVGAGENWSMALSSDGHVWTWGACGGAVLGHGLYGSQKNAILAETILQRHQRLVAQCEKATTSLSSCPRLPQLKWMTPQKIPCFATPDIRICRISAGTQHAAAIADSGDLYMWGEGDPVSDGLVLSSLPKLVNSGQLIGGEDTHAAEIGTHSVEHVVCGGRQTIAFTSGSFLARSMSKLYRDSVVQGNPDGSSTDLVLIVSGQRLLVHKLLLAQRSPVLRELILKNEQQRLEVDRSHTITSTGPMELLLPRLRVDIARALVEFIYTDNFTMDVNRNSYYLVHDVLRAAKIYKLPSLMQLCHERLLSAAPSSLFDASAPSSMLNEIAEDDEQSDTNSEEDIDEHKGVRDATRTLNDDMKFALSDEVWADTVLLAEGRFIPVHRCLLTARSEYFRAVLAFRRSAANLIENAPTDTNLAVMNVEDSYAGIVRVLRFIYYDQVTLPQVQRNRVTKENIVKNESYNTNEREDEEDASDQLLEDLVAADKYGLKRMKRLCEHAISVTATNCLEVLAVAELVHAAHLKQVAMRFIQTHLAVVIARREEFQRFQEDFPQLLEELYTSLRDASRDEFLLREWHTDVGTRLAAEREERELERGKESAAATFPWVPLSLTVAFGTMYLSMMETQEHEYTAVPATNLVAIAAIGGAIMMGGSDGTARVKYKHWRR